MRGKVFLLAVCIFCLMTSSALGMQVATVGSGVYVYADSSSREPVGMVFNGYQLRARSARKNGRTECTFPHLSGIVWVDRETAEENMPDAWYANPGMTARKKLDMPCEMFLAEVIADEAPLYADWDHTQLTATHGKGTLVRVCGLFGDYYLVDNVSVYNVYDDIAGYMPKECLQKLRDLTYPQASVEGYGWENVKEATVYTDGYDLAVGYSATGYCAMPPRVLKDREKVKVLSVSGDWAQLADGGFVETRFLDPDGDHSISYVTVKASKVLNRVNVRRDADADSDAMVKLCSGAKVQVPSRTEKWASVYVGGATGSNKTCGCVMTEFLSFDDTKVENGCTRVRLTKDLYGNVDNTIFGEDGPVARYTGEQLAAETEMTVIGVSAHYMEEYGDLFICLLEDGRVVRISDAASNLIPLEGTGIVVKTNTGVKLRQEASKNAGSLRTLSNGTKVEVLLRGEGWTMVQYRDQVGYVMSRYLNFP